MRKPETFRMPGAKQGTADNYRDFVNLNQEQNLSIVAVAALHLIYHAARAEFKHSCSCCVVYQML